jgi:hypothetical protein
MRLFTCSRFNPADITNARLTQCESHVDDGFEQA